MEKVIISPLTIESVHFPGTYLRMDGNGVKELPDGSGTVNCQIGAHPWEKFKFIKYEDGTYVIESLAFPNTFLRMDGKGVTGFAGAGAGKVNCQAVAKEWEHFKMHKQEDGTYTIESVQFPNVYLRMDATGFKEYAGNGGGTVNCQHGAQYMEKFRICADL